MAFNETRFTLMALPQKVDANGIVTIHIVFIPRNINPLEDVFTKFGAGNKALAFVKAKPNFKIVVVNNPDEFAGTNPGAPDEKSLSPLQPFTYSANAENLYLTLRDAKDENGNAKYFDIDPSRSSDKAGSEEHRAPKAEKNRDIAVRKYLPRTYRNAFNFTQPRLKNAVTDDSYHCALRDKAPDDKVKIDDKVSWGQVYAHLLRQPLLAKQAGLFYETSIQLEPSDFENGGWIYIDLENNSDYAIEQNASTADAEGPFIKSYAARIPSLKSAEARNLFTSVLFPVVVNGISPKGSFDELYIEAARFHDGFATIVHANQAISGNTLSEEQDGFHPQKESGIRLGWEDEQILVWYLRQLAADENTGERLDAPLGVMGYAIDVKKADAEDSAWESLNEVKSNGALQLEGINFGDFTGELPYQVYPTKIYNKNTDTNNFWLPMYFAHWNNESLVLPDKTASRIYRNTQDNKKPVVINETYSAIETNTKLLYGNSYQFRVRFSDISGGGPSLQTPLPNTNSLSSKVSTSFKRYVAPASVTVLNNEDDIISLTDSLNFTGTSLTLSRPLLGYPAVVYTGKYSNPVDRLIQSLQTILDEAEETKNDVHRKGAKVFGIPDPDVVAVSIKVEIETLKMDNLASDDGRESYITLYQTKRFFPVFDENNADITIDIPLSFKDIPVLQLNEGIKNNKPFLEEADNACIEEDATTLILPTARTIRLTIRGIGDKSSTYWGYQHDTDESLSSHYGKTTVFHLRQESENEEKIFIHTEDPQTTQAIYLQPDPVEVKLGMVASKRMQGGQTGLPNIVQRLATQLDVDAKELTLVTRKGERLQFWCSNLIRHSMAPDNSSITFSNKEELQNQWLVCTSLWIDRDWTWDSLDVSSLHIKRKRSLLADGIEIKTEPFKFIGDLELKKIASFQSIQEGKDKKINRQRTRVIFIDVIDDKPSEQAKFPDNIELLYAIEPKFRNTHHPVKDAQFESKLLKLPTTVNPMQMPKLLSAGIALSPYNRNSTYSATEARTRFLWLEFDKKPRDKNDALFCRVLAYSPDQLLSNNHPSLMVDVQEPPLNLDPEYIRVITPVSAQDNNGLDAMQQMEKSIDKDRHYYILPLPPGLHHESPELFGMFTYEFRFGHSDKIWSTAQGRFGRALRVAGLQHPAPNLTCMVNRNEKGIQLSASFATAVYNGKDVTASPPHTAMWGLLYAQVKQADGLDYRNILLDEMELTIKKSRKLKEVSKELIERFEAQNIRLQKQKLQPVVISNELIQQQTFQQVSQEKESKQYASGEWNNKEIVEMLRLYGLPEDASLSVLCVEVFGHITNVFEHMDDFNQNKRELIQQTARVFDQETAQQLRREYDVVNPPSAAKAPIDPLNSQLGLFRILRTSPLTEVPFICCTDCD